MGYIQLFRGKLARKLWVKIEHPMVFLLTLLGSLAEVGRLIKHEFNVFYCACLPSLGLF